MTTTLQISDGSRTHHLEIRTLEQGSGGEHTVEIRSPEDVHAHMLSIAPAVDGFMKVSARDGRALRVEVHDHPAGWSFRAAAESSDEVEGHALEEHSWEATIDEDDDVEGHDASKADAARFAFGAAAAYVAMHDTSSSSKRLLHRIEAFRGSRADDDVSGHITPPGLGAPGRPGTL